MDHATSYLGHPCCQPSRAYGWHDRPGQGRTSLWLSLPWLTDDVTQDDKNKAIHTDEHSEAIRELLKAGASVNAGDIVSDVCS